MDDAAPALAGASLEVGSDQVTLVRGDHRVRPNSSESEHFEDFYRAHRADAVRWAIALVGDRAVAEELAQDALAAVGAKLRTIDNPAGYLRRTVVNRAASWHRSHARERKRMRHVAAGEPTAYTAETSEMLGALAVLPYKQRAAVTLRYWSDWTDDEIADALDCAPATVRVLLHRGLATLKHQLTQELSR
jgi:RNA polymerase sigma factor (sigma-70 family)